MEELCQSDYLIIRDKPCSLFNPQNGQVAKFISGKLELFCKRLSVTAFLSVRSSMTLLTDQVFRVAFFIPIDLISCHQLSKDEVLYD